MQKKTLGMVIYPPMNAQQRKLFGQQSHIIKLKLKLKREEEESAHTSLVP
jgi:hypothetical protein